MDSSSPLPANPEAHMAHAATAPPRPGSNHRDHPPYTEMIISAIKALNEKKGSSKTAIAKFIDAAYTNLSESHSALLSRHLKRLKKNGHVLMIKHSYTLPKSPKKPRGRPPNPSSGSVTPKRGRGRPPKSMGPSGTVLSKRGPGRPPKSMAPSGPVLSKRGRGRPPKSIGPTGPVLSKKGRGRPPKSNSIIIPCSDGVVAAIPLPGSRPRGRPKKDASASASSTALAQVVIPPIVVSIGRPRGRPPKAGGVSVAKPKKVSSGRPVGRPRKVTIAE